MMEILNVLGRYLLPLVFFASGVILGFVVEKIILLQIKKVAIRSKWDGGSIIVYSLKGITFLWFTIAGAYAALLNVDFISPHYFAYIKSAIIITLIFSATILFSKLSTGFVKLYAGRVLPSTSIFVNLTKVFVFILGMLVLLQTLGVSVAPIITALGVGGLAVALALQDTLSNLFAGLHIIASKKVRTGDYIKLESGQEGYLEDITWRNTSIRTAQNNTVIVPNNKIASAILINYNIPTKDFDLPISVNTNYNSDLEKVELITREVAVEVLQKLNAFVKEPAVRYSAFGDTGITFNVVMRVKEFSDQGLIRHEFIKKLHKRFQEEGIEIPFNNSSASFNNQGK